MTYKTYNQYIDSDIKWIGAIPSSWKLLKSKFIFNRINNQSTTGNEELLSVSEYYGVKPKKETINEGDFLSRSESLVGYKKCSKNDLVMNIMLAWKKGLGVTNYDGIVSPAYEIFNINLQLAFPRYMNYLLRTDLYASEFKRHSYGVIDSRLRLYPDNFKEIECILPPIDEQQQIANYLDKQTTKIDATIEKNKELIELLEEKRVALINQVVTKGLNPNVPMRDSGVEWIGEMPKKWEVTNLKKYFSIHNGSTPKDLEENWGGDICWITPADYKTTDVYINHSSRQITKRGLNSCGTTLVPKGSIIVSNRAPIGTVAIANTDLCTNQGCKSLSIKKDINNKFVYYILSINEKELNNLGRGTTFMELSSYDLGTFPIPIPSILEQEKIVEYLDNEILKINKTLTKIQDNITLLKEYKTSLIYHVVTGKIDVRGEVV